MGLHQGLPAATAGAPLDRARAAMVLLHGRGSSPESILSLVALLDRPAFSFVAPRASAGTWYPYSFMEPLERNEPSLSSALEAIADLVVELESAGIGRDRCILAGFSQGACLASEFAARNARRYGGVAALSGGLIGPPGVVREYPGSLEGTPVFLGCSDVDPHIPAHRVEETARVLEALGASVTKRLYRGMGHSVNDDEIAHVQTMMDALLHDRSPSEEER